MRRPPDTMARQLDRDLGNCAVFRWLQLSRAGFLWFAAGWRRGWDSNPRLSFPNTRFPSVLLKPLGHLSSRQHQSNRIAAGSETPAGKVVSRDESCVATRSRA
jgi:hypothetical protein